MQKVIRSYLHQVLQKHIFLYIEMVIITIVSIMIIRKYHLDIFN